MTTTTRSMTPIAYYDAVTVRSVQQALNDRGYNAGPVNGQYGTERRMRCDGSSKSPACRSRVNWSGPLLLRWACPDGPLCRAARKL